MKNPADVSVVICTNMTGIARTLRMALRGMGVRKVVLAANTQQLVEGFAVSEPHCVILYVDSDNPSDDGLMALNFIRRSDDSPNPRIPVIAVSPRRDLQTINAVINGGAHEYVLFPSAGNILLKKIISTHMTPRPWIDREDYVGPERRIDREMQSGDEQAAAS